MIIDELRPTAAEAEHMQALVARLLSEAQAAIDAGDVPAEATVQGSMAKDTWIAGNMDLDLFILIDPAVDEAAFPAITQRVAGAVLDEPKARYAQHPYLVGDYEGLQVDVVPAYRVADASAMMSAVDRTPFHTAWVREHLTPAQRDDVRLTKQWMKGVGIYGAETAIAGFSGYLVEVLVHALGSFDAVIEWLADEDRPRTVTPVEGLDQPAALIVADPVDPARNCAAAVAEDTLQRGADAARAYLAEPSRAFFFPKPPSPAPPGVLADALEARGEIWVGLWMPGADRLDIVLPQFQKATARIQDAWGRAGFDVHEAHTWTDGDHVGMQFLIDAAPLPAQKRHEGPPADSPHADRFHTKWAEHPDNLHGVQQSEGRLFVDLRIPARTPAAWYTAHRDRLPLGKHVERVLPESILFTEPGEVPSPWSPIVTDFILQRRPWQR